MFRLIRDVRRGAPQRRRRRRRASLNFVADVSLVRPRGRCRRGNNEGDSAETATSPNCWAAIGLRRSRMKTATGHTREATVPRRHLVGPFRACLRFFPRAVNAAEQITEVRRLTRALVRFFRHRWRLLRAVGRCWTSENGGRSARMAWSPNHIANTDPRAANVATGPVYLPLFVFSSPTGSLPPER